MPTTFNSTSYRQLRPIINTSLEQVFRECPLPADRTLLREVLRLTRTGAYLAALAMSCRTHELAIQGEALRQQGITDPVTGLDNRRGYDTNIQESFSLAREQRQPVTVISLDLNNMGQINQHVGQAEGDRWVKTTATILKQSTDRRPARWGGDEYAVVLPGAGRNEAAEWWENVHPLFDEAGIRISAGAAICHPFTSDLDSAIATTQKAAETAMQAAKKCAKPLDISAMHFHQDIIMAGRQ